MFHCNDGPRVRREAITLRARDMTNSSPMSVLNTLHRGHRGTDDPGVVLQRSDQDRRVRAFAEVILSVAGEPREARGG